MGRGSDQRRERDWSLWTLTPAPSPGAPRALAAESTRVQPQTWSSTRRFCEWAAGRGRAGVLRRPRRAHRTPSPESEPQQGAAGPRTSTGKRRTLASRRTREKGKGAGAASR